MPKTVDVLIPKKAVPILKCTYRAFLLDLSRNLKDDDLKELKFVLEDIIPRGVMEKLDKPLDVFSALEERNLLASDKLDGLRECFEAIDRPKLIEMVDSYEDAGTKFPLKPSADNRLEKGGYSVSVKGGRHFDTTQGEFVEVRSGSTYSLIAVNQNNHRCLLHIQIDGYEMFPNGFALGPKETFTFERPSKEKKKFKFFAISDAPSGSGINKWRKEENGIIRIKFSPEREDMKITCVAAGSATQVVSCSRNITDLEFLIMMYKLFGSVITVMINGWKPLGKREAKLYEYGIGSGSRVHVNVGGSGGTCFAKQFDIDKNGKKKIKCPWKAGATTLEDLSEQKFGNGEVFPVDPLRATTLSLRLVARKHEIPLPTTGNPTPLTRATLTPPPVPN